MSNKLSGQVRIIGGTLRHRIIEFPPLEGVRPTPNRIRETLFNWLAPHIRGASCLDMFAGSGALSFEAKSRGAGYSVLLDASCEIVQALAQNITRLKITDVDVIQATFPYDPTIAPGQFDIVFLDPPFHEGYVQAALNWLTLNNKLKNQSLIYIESEADIHVFELSEGWEIIKDKKAGQVRYSLVIRH